MDRTTASAVFWGGLGMCLATSAAASAAEADGPAVAVADEDRPPAAKADSPAGLRPSFEAGARLGLGVPFGGVDAGNKDAVGETMSLMVPIWLEAGVRIRQKWHVGLYLVIGPGTLGGGLNAACSLPDGCHVVDIQFGASAHYHARPGKTFDPWVGVGAGHEWLSILTSGGGPTADGWTWLLIESGVEIKASERAVWGPFVTASLGRYESFGNRFLAARPPDLALHEWLMLGVRVAYDFLH